MNFNLEIIFFIGYLLGVIGIYVWQRRKLLNSSFFYILLFSGLALLAYTLFLEYREGSYFFLLPLVFFSIFAISYFREKRRLINGLLFNFFLMSFGSYLLFVMFEAQSIFLGGLLSVIGLAILFTLAFGIYALILFLYWNSYLVLKKESFSLANLLTLLLGIGLTIYLLIELFVLSHLPDWLAILFFIVPLMLGYFFVVFYNYLTISVLYQFNRPKYNQDYIIVLGAGLIDGKTVTPLLAKRIDKAIQFYKAQKRATMKTPMILMSGGKGSDESVSEAEAMRAYALEQGIAAEDILMETNSRTTLENMKFSKEIMDAGSDQPYNAIFTSNNFHIFRAGLFARQAKIKADGIGAKTAGYYLPNAFLREFVAIVALHKKRHIIVFLFFLAFVILFALISLLFS
ncbi:YdcF family protein [Enterococcus sp. HY326]|uniref:YdcF family protein n=1 Tax=Enterococcus sp. HY326 TaxID=2971265 RepID=UPI00223EE56A|nr:YdcF family protein [Enterococcus sp. HY326]